MQTTFRSLFFDFLVYMFAKINGDHNLDIVFDEHCTSNTLDLFLSLLQTVPVPDLKLLQILTATVILQEAKESKYHSKFPFFKYVSEAVDKCIDESREKVNQGTWPTPLQGNTDQLQEDTTSDVCKKSKQLMEELFCKLVKPQIKVHIP